MTPDPHASCTLRHRDALRLQWPCHFRRLRRPRARSELFAISDPPRDRVAADRSLCAILYLVGGSPRIQVSPAWCQVTTSPRRTTSRRCLRARSLARGCLSRCLPPSTRAITNNIWRTVYVHYRLQFFSVLSPIKYTRDTVGLQQNGCVKVYFEVLYWACVLKCQLFNTAPGRLSSGEAAAARRGLLPPPTHLDALSPSPPPLMRALSASCISTLARPPGTES